MSPEAASSAHRTKGNTDSSQSGSWLERISMWDNVEADAHIRKGLSITLATYLQELMDLTDEEAAHLIGRSRSTYNRYRNEGRQLGSSEAERALRYARLISLAADTFGTIGEAKDWMLEANYALGGRVPFEMAETDPGARLVQDLLLGLQYGNPV